jgi:hypothetical protein
MPNRTLDMGNSRTVPAAVAVTAVLMLAVLSPWPVSAEVSPDPCPGNICTGSMTIGTDTITYAYTEHVNPDGEFKVRLNGGEYSTTKLISYIVFDLPPFASWDEHHAPDAVSLPDEAVNPGRTAYERSAPTGLSGQTVDQVMAVRYAGLAEGEYTFNIFVLQEAGSASKNNLSFYVDALATSNGNENESLELINEPTPCADRWPRGEEGISIDNDLNYQANCADPVCDGQPGHPIDTDLVCQQVESRCYDGFDNDADDDVDCADRSCDEQVGREAGGGKTIAYCQYGNEYGAPLSLGPEGTSPCDDNFDNDADGREDCYDNLYTDTVTGATTPYDTLTTALTQSRICWRHSVYNCPQVETSCTDGLDNDIDKSYSDNEYEYTQVDGVDVPAVPSSGKDCLDYDCAGDANCPDQENRDMSNGGVDSCLCFDTADNDLDHQIDCRDPDCSGAYCAETGRECVDSEFSLSSRVQMCENAFDDDGDVTEDCQDTDCKEKFGNCGPCPNREDISYLSCSDNRDNDVNGSTDCEDPRCVGSFGNTENAAYCTEQNGSSETGSSLFPRLCHDGLDNDGDGKTDCADPGCDDAVVGSAGQRCESPTETKCSDNFDNDGLNGADCVDPACAGQPGCSAADWDGEVACIEMNKMSVMKTFTGNDPTVGAQSFETARVNEEGSSVMRDEIRIVGDDAYSSLSVYIGDNTDVSKVYPYAVESGCELSDTQPDGDDAAKMEMIVTVNGAVPGGAMMIYNKEGETISDFDLTVSCPTPSEPAELKNYTVSISVLRSGDIPEYGETSFRTRLYEATVPSVVTVEPAGKHGASVDVPYGSSLQFRVIPDDPTEPDDTTPPLWSSGICQCRISLGGEEYQSTGGDCLVTTTEPMYEDSGAVPLEVVATAVDGAGNISPDFPVSFSINVTPAVTDDRPMSAPAWPPERAAGPFFNKRDASNKINVDIYFATATQNTFGADCYLYIRNSTGAVVGGPSPIAIDNLNYNGLTPNLAYCVGTGVPLPAALTNPSVDTDGAYFASVGITDDENDYVESRRQPIFMCDTVPGPDDDPDDGDVCHWADFDGDGFSEGLFTTLYSSEPKACDNCVNLYNPSQSDADASGIGADCEGMLGRCEVDTDLVCTMHSFDYGLDPESGIDVCPGAKCCDRADNPNCCPAPTVKADSEGDHPDRQACRSNWGVCSSGGEICFDAQDCPARGLCANEENSGDLCNHSPEDCGGDPDSCIGYDLCANLMYPWIQAPGGSVFSGQFIRAPEPPPPGRANATYCITAKSGIGYVTDPDAPPPDPNNPDEPAIKYVFTSAECGLPMTRPASRLERPTARNVYSTVLGRLDLGGLLSGKYGVVVPVANPQNFVDEFLNNSYLANKVYVISGDLVIGERSEESAALTTITDAPQDESGAGTVIVLGGNLYFWNNVRYSPAITGGLTALRRLASIGWIVLDENNPRNPGYNTKGNVLIGKNVTDLVGAFFVGGQGGVYTVAPPDIDSSEALTVRGLMIARQFHFSRSYKSSVRGSEQVIYDGRAVVNPPPGFGDVNKTLPYFGEAPSLP